MVVTEHIVNNVEELLNAWDSAQSGDTIYLKAGEYGDVSLRRAEFEDTVTITSLDPENPAMLNTLALVEVDNVQVKSLVIDLTANETTSQEVRGILVSGSKNVQVHDNVINGDDSVVGVPITSDPDTKLNNVPYIGEPIGNAVYVVRSEGIIISENEITGFRRGINLFESEGVIVRDNEVYDLRQTVLRGVNSDDVLIEGNEFHSIHPVNYGGRGDHANFIQFRQAMGSEEFSENITIKDNFFHQGSGIPVRGVVFATSDPDGIGYKNITVDNNVMYNGDKAGVVFENVENGIITNNTLVQSSGEFVREAPGIRIDFSSKYINVEGNITSDVNIHSDRVDLASTTIHNNLLVQSFDAQSSAYVGKVLANGLVDMAYASLEDFAIAPDYNSAGVGAQIETSGNIFFDVDVPQGTSNSMTASLTVEGAEEGAGTYQYVLEDGTVLKGPDVEVTFDTDGKHEITLIKTINGGSEAFTRTVQVFDPVLFMLHEDADNSSSNSQLIAYGDPDVKGSRATFNGDGDYIKLDNAGFGLRNASEASVSFRFSFDAASDDRETLARVSNFFTIHTKNDTLTAVLMLSDGENVTLSTKIENLQDGRATDLALTFDEASSTMKLFVNGDIRDAAYDLEGFIDIAGNAPLIIGGFGASGNFKGWIEDFSLQLNSNISEPLLVDDIVPKVTTNLDNSDDGFLVNQLQDTQDNAKLDPFYMFEGGYALDLGGKGSQLDVSKDEIEAFFAAENFEISMKIQSDGSSDAYGEVFRVHLNVIVNVLKDGNLSVKFFSEDGEVTELKTSDLSLIDGEEHDVSIRFDGTAGELSLLVNGNVAGQQSVEQSISSDMNHWGLTFGNPWGKKNFEGTVKEFAVNVAAEDNNSIPETAAANIDNTDEGFLVDQLQDIQDNAQLELLHVFEDDYTLNLGGEGSQLDVSKDKIEEQVFVASDTMNDNSSDSFTGLGFF